MLFSFPDTFFFRVPLEAIKACGNQPTNVPFLFNIFITLNGLIECHQREHLRNWMNFNAI